MNTPTKKEIDTTTQKDVEVEKNEVSEESHPDTNAVWVVDCDEKSFKFAMCE